MLLIRGQGYELILYTAPSTKSTKWSIWNDRILSETSFGCQKMTTKQCSSKSSYFVLHGGLSIQFMQKHTFVQRSVLPGDEEQTLWLARSGDEFRRVYNVCPVRLLIFRAVADLVLLLLTIYRSLSDWLMTTTYWLYRLVDWLLCKLSPRWRSVSSINLAGEDNSSME